MASRLRNGASTSRSASSRGMAAPATTISPATGTNRAANCRPAGRGQGGKLEQGEAGFWPPVEFCIGPNKFWLITEFAAPLGLGDG